MEKEQVKSLAGWLETLMGISAHNIGSPVLVAKRSSLGGWDLGPQAVQSSQCLNLFVDSMRSEGK